MKRSRWSKNRRNMPQVTLPPFRELSEDGYKIAIVSLTEKGFKRVRRIRDKDRVVRRDGRKYKISYGSLLASKGGREYVIQLRTRHKYKKNRKLNRRYKLTDPRFRGDFHADVALAEDRFRANAHWMAVQIHRGRYNVFFDSLTVLGGKLSIPMAAPRKRYTCLAWRNSISSALAKHEIIGESNLSTIVHISDLHFRKSSDANITRGRLLQSLRENKRRIDYVVISGDIADQCRSEGYEAAVEFVTALALGLGINRNEIKKRVLIVPGNHDVDYVQSKRSYGYSKLRPKENKYLKRFKSFSEHFFRPVFAQEFPLQPRRQWFRRNSGQDNVLLLGFNSAYRIDHINQERVELDEGAVSEALDYGEQFLKSNRDGVIIAVMHHPVSGGPRCISEKQAKLFSARERLVCILHGDSHRPDISSRGPVYGSNPMAVGAGYAGLSPRQLPSGVPWSYHCIQLNWIKKQAIVQTKMRDHENGPWIPYTRYRRAGSRLRDTFIIHW